MLNTREPKTAPKAEQLLRIEGGKLTRPCEANEPRRPREHRCRWRFPLGLILTALLTVPGPSTLTDAEITLRRRPPMPRVAGPLAPSPVTRPTSPAGVRPPKAA